MHFSAFSIISGISLKVIFFCRKSSTASSFVWLRVAQAFVPFFAASYARRRQGNVSVSGFSNVSVFIAARSS